MAIVRKREPYVYQLQGFKRGQWVILMESEDMSSINDAFDVALKNVREDPTYQALQLTRLGYPGSWKSWTRPDPAEGHTKPKDPKGGPVKGGERSVP